MLTIPKEQYPAYSVGFHVVWNKRFGNAVGATPPWLAHFLGGPNRANPTHTTYSRSSTGWGMLTRGICGTRERNSWILLWEIAYAAVLIAPETCLARN